MDPRELDRRVLEDIDHILASVGVEDLGRPTPCTDWTLDDLLRHMVGHHRGFAAAAEGATPDPDVWDGATLGTDPYGTYRDAASLVTRAFAADDLLERRLEVFGYGTFPASVALNMHSVDFLAHGWDVARAIGVDDALDEDLCTIGLRIASRWPDTPATWGPTGPFRARIPVPDDATAGQRLMGFLGRPPGWTAPQSR